MARAREVRGLLDCEGQFRRAAARVVEARAAEVFEHAHGVLDLEDAGPVHDMRVATRRLRAAMEIFEPCFPSKRHRKALKRVKALADALGERRDRDVEIELLSALAREAGEGGSEEVARLIAGIREEQREANEALAPRVSSKRLEKLRRRLERLVREAG